MTLVGEEGAAHRVNSVAAALHAGLTVSEVGQLDFGYSPPFGPVWDPVLLAAKALGDELETVGDERGAVGDETEVADDGTEAAGDGKEAKDDGRSAEDDDAHRT